MPGELYKYFWEFHESFQTVIIFTVIGCLLLDIYLYFSRPWTLYITRVTQCVLISVVFIDCWTCELLGKKPSGIAVWIVLAAGILAHALHRKIPRLRAINSTLETVIFFLWPLTMCIAAQQPQFDMAFVNVVFIIKLTMLVFVLMFIWLVPVKFEIGELFLIFCGVYFTDETSLRCISSLYLLIIVVLHAFSTPSYMELIVFHALPLYCLSPSQVMVFPDISIDISDFLYSIV